MMFQTGRRAGAAARLYAAHPDHPAGDSLAAYLYEKMPNDTDFSVALAHGLPGLNYAFIGRPELYHTPAATPAAVEAGAVQSLGDQAWAVVAPLAYGATLPQPSPDETWFDLFGRGVVIYPPAAGWIVLALGALGMAFAGWAPRRRAAGLRAVDVAIGVAQSLVATIIMALALLLYGRSAVHGYYPALAHSAQTQVVVAVAGLASGLLAFQGLGPAAQPLARWTGAVGLAWLLGVLLQLAAPRAAFLAEWPVLLSALALCVASWRPGALGGGVAAVCAVLTLGFLLEFWRLLVLGVGLVMPVAGVAPLPFALAALAPLLQRWRRDDIFG